MNAYLLSSGRVIEPFGESVGLSPVHNQTLEAFQQEQLANLGAKVERIDSLEQIRQFPCLVLCDDLYTSESALAAFVEQARARPRESSWQAALTRSVLTESLAPNLQGEKIKLADGGEARRYELFWLNSAPASTTLEEHCEPLLIPHRWKSQKATVSTRFVASGKYELPISTVIFQPITHWSCIVSANLLGMRDRLARLALRRPVGAAFALALAPWRAASLFRRRIAGKLYLAGKRCKIHPSAHVEGAILGDNVRIGPNAVVRGCIIGSRSEIGASAVVEGCNIGERVVVNPTIVVRGVVLCDHAAMGSNYIQFSIAGKRSVVCPSGGLLDFSLVGNVHVWKDGALFNTGTRLLGGCLGHDAFLGPFTLVHCGRHLNNGCVIVQDPQTVVMDCESIPRNSIRLDRGRKKAVAASTEQNANAEHRAA